MGRGEKIKKIRWRLWANIAFGCAVLLVLVLTGRATRRFVISDPRFALPSADDRSAGLSMDGLVNASRSRVLATFNPDFGRSIFLVPLAERRRRLMAIDWVEDAYIARIWPNRVAVHVKERKPVAFVNMPIPGTRSSRVLLIDPDGVLLEPPPHARFNFPVLSGITEDQSDMDRRYRVRSMVRLLDDLGPLGKDISEVNAAAPENLTIIAQVEGHTVALMMGNRNFARRLQSFLDHYPEIRRQSPGITAFDLRLDDRITAENRE